MIDTERLRKHIKHFDECSDKFSKALDDLYLKYNEMNQDTQKMLDNLPGNNNWLKRWYKREISSLVNEVVHVESEFRYLKNEVDDLHDNVNNLEFQYQNEVKKRAIKDNFKCFLYYFIFSASIFGTPISAVLFILSMTRGNLYEEIVWALGTILCLSVLFTILDRGDWK